MSNARLANWGDRMIQLEVYLWTDNIARGEGKIYPKHARAKGVVRLERNRAHGISPQKDVKFNSIMELPVAVEKALIQAGVTLHPSQRMRKYYPA